MKESHLKKYISTATTTTNNNFLLNSIRNNWIKIWDESARVYDGSSKLFIIACFSNSIPKLTYKYNSKTQMVQIFFTLLANTREVMWLSIHFYCYKKKVDLVQQKTSKLLILLQKKIIFLHNNYISKYYFLLKIKY